MKYCISKAIENLIADMPNMLRLYQHWTLRKPTQPQSYMTRPCIQKTTCCSLQGLSAPQKKATVIMAKGLQVPHPQGFGRHTSPRDQLCQCLWLTSGNTTFLIVRAAPAPLFSVTVVSLHSHDNAQRSSWQTIIHISICS